MGRNLIETIMGAVVLLVAGFFLVFAYSHADLKEVKGYSIIGPVHQRRRPGVGVRRAHQRHQGRHVSAA